MTDGHTEEIEVTDDVATFDELQKYEKKVERKEMRQPIFLERLKDKGFDFSTLTEVLLTVSETQGLTFSLTLPYIKTQSILSLVREIYSQEQLDTLHQLTYYDNAAFTAEEPINYKVVLREGTVSATAGSIPTIEAVFVIAQ